MIDNKSFIAGENDKAKRLDKVIISHFPEFSRSSLEKQNSTFFVNGKAQKAGYKVKEKDQISFILPEIKEISLEKENIPLDIVYEDNDIIVINKDTGMVTHPAKGHENHTLVNALLYYKKDTLPIINGETRPGIVHRLDKDTYGLLVVALNDKSMKQLTKDFKDRKITKVYYGLVKGHTPESGTIETQIGRSPHDRKKMAVVEEGKYALTHYKTLSYIGENSLVAIHLETGRTHQIRVHFSYINHPILGDPLYSNDKKKYPFKGIALISAKLSLVHPITKKSLSFSIPLPKAIAEYIKKK